jgi:hypothetical protein
MKKIIILLFISVLLTSCFKDDEMVPPHDSGDVNTVIIPMTQYYTYQLYFNLENNEVVESNEREIFDLNFECLDTSSVIRLNTANFALIAETGFENFEDVKDTVGLNWKFDKSDGNPDSLAINNWITVLDSDTSYSNKVWVLNRGLSAMGLQLGLVKLKFTELKNHSFHFVFCDMDNNNMHEVVVPKDNGYRYVQYSLSNGGEAVQTEPPANTWDLFFTQYTTMLFTNEGLAYPYIVNGVLKSPESKIAVDSSMNFNDISLSDTNKFDFSTNYDAIGYDWKRIEGDVQTGDYVYVAHIEWNYIIKDDKSLFYKLRFISFYDPATGEKGYPTFEYQPL